MRMSALERQTRCRRRKESGIPAPDPTLRRLISYGYCVFTYYLRDDIFDRSAPMQVFTTNNAPYLLSGADFINTIQRRAAGMVGALHPLGGDFEVRFREAAPWLGRWGYVGPYVIDLSGF